MNATGAAGEVLTFDGVDLHRDDTLLLLREETVRGSALGRHAEAGRRP